MNRKYFFLLLAMVCIPVFAEGTPDVTIVKSVTGAIDAAASNLIMPKAILWLSSLMGIQFILTNIGLIKSGADLEAIFGKLFGSLLWFGFCYYVIENGPDFINSVGIDILNTFAPNLPGPGSIITATLALCSTLLAAIAITGTSVVGTGNSAVANVLILVMLTVFSVGMFMAIKILMISLELALVVMLSPLSFSLLGLNALKDQGIAPFKSLISLAYRIILLGILCTAFTEVVATAGDQLSSIEWTNPTQWGDGLKIILSILCAYPVIAYFVYKSDSIAATLASGSTNMGTADVASAAAAGAAAGAAVMTGGASAVSGTTRGGQSMGNFMNGLMNGGGSVSNASSTGAGQSPAGPAPTRPTMSLGGAAPTASNKPPSRSTTPASSGGNPTPKTENAGSANQNASIGGSSPDLEKKLENLTDAMNNQGKKGFKDRVSDVNDHIAREQASTHISINTHPSD